MALYFVTGNHGKFAELSEIIPGLKRLDLDLEEIQSLDPKVVIEHKLAQAAAVHDGTFIVEDTTAGFSCIQELPGTFIKWFLDTLKPEGLADLVLRYDDHTAIMRTTIGLRDEQGETHYFVGERRGKIVSPRGNNGFGLDPIFIADGQTKTNAELSQAEKNAISARGKAARQLAAHLHL
ncbi:MAG TPA: non-canonical purine NTP pyrophosphatase [Candidatus Saccharimonadia bacterium]|jgi:inosine triphosphate pyrophosphatase|nr:non-canonical purine NTP pyrophosphatase [Candidatus Saccharimonadia bacterium]